MTTELRVGVIGCGNISTAYFTLAPLFRGLKITACADMNMAIGASAGREVRPESHER